MDNKVILISIDGMRPDGLLACGNPFVEEMKGRGTYSLKASSVVPSVTLPCHMSIFHSVPPERHGVTTNTYSPPVRQISGLFEHINVLGGKCAMFYGWEPIREIHRAPCLKKSEFIWAYSVDNTDRILTEHALDYIKAENPDFVFLYMVETDEKGGHDSGWMTPAYLDCINKAVDNVKTVLESVGEEYSVIVTADHGGHDRTHGSTLPEDMTIPMFFFGKDFEAGKEIENINLLDIAPTIADVMNIPAPMGWEGKSILK